MSKRKVTFSKEALIIPPNPYLSWSGSTHPSPTAQPSPPQGPRKFRSVAKVFVGLGQGKAWYGGRSARGSPKRGTSFGGSEQAPSGQKHRSPRSLPRDRFSLFFPFSPSFHPPPSREPPKYASHIFGNPYAALGLDPPTGFVMSVRSSADGRIRANKQLLTFPVVRCYNNKVTESNGRAIGCRKVLS